MRLILWAKEAEMNSSALGNADLLQDRAQRFADRYRCGAMIELVPSPSAP
jgi:hypothetical protein